MLFTQAQARSVADVSAETLRHWRKAVPYLAAKSGKAARFSFADLIALAATREAIGTLGLGIAEIGVGVDALFHVFAEAPWSSLDGAIVMLSATTAELHYAVGTSQMKLSGPTVLIPCGPLVQHLRDELLPSPERDFQHHLLFPPQSVKSA